MSTQQVDEGTRNHQDITAPVANLREAGARGSGIMLAVQGLRMFLLFASTVMLARLLTPEDFGLVAMVAAIIGVAEVIRDFGLSTATMQAPTLSPDERTNLFWANFGLGLVCTLIALAATPWIVRLYDEPRLTTVIPALAVVFAINGFNTQFRAGLARNLRYKALGLTDVAAQTLAIAVAVVLAAMGFGVGALLAQQLINAIAAAILFVVVSKWWPTLPRPHVSIRRFLRFGGGVFGTQVIGYVMKNIDNVAIGASLGAVPLGLYSRAYQLMVTPLRQINAPLTQVAVPVLSRVKDDESFMRYLTRSQLVTNYVTTTLFAVAIGLAQPIVLVLFGQEWIGVVPIFVALAVGGMFRVSSQVAYWTYLARGQSGALLVKQTAAGAVSVLFILMGLHWGVVGVAVGVAAGALFGWLISVWHAGRSIRVNLWPLVTNSFRDIAVVGIPCGAAAYLGSLLPVAPVAQILAGSAFAGAYLALAWLVLPQVRADLNFTASLFMSMVPRRWRRVGLARFSQLRGRRVPA